MSELLQMAIVSVVAVGGLAVVYRSVFGRRRDTGAGASCPKCASGDPCGPDTPASR